AMVSAVVRQMLHHLPERLSVGVAFGGAVIEDARQVFGRARGRELEQLTLDGGPVFRYGCRMGKRYEGRKRARSTPAEALEREPFARDDGQEGIAHGAKAGVQVACELLLGQRSAGIQRAASGPAVVLVEEPNLFWAHPSFLPIPKSRVRARARSLKARPLARALPPADDRTRRRTESDPGGHPRSNRSPRA